MSAVLITGVNGFVGKHLARELSSLDYQIIGVGQQPNASSEIVEILDDYHAADLTNPNQVASLPLDRVDAVISLAGLAKVGASYGQLDEYEHINVGVVTNIAKEMLHRDIYDVRHVVVSTSMVYDPRQRSPFSEDSRLINDDSVDASPYALSKLAMEKAVEGYRDKGLDVIIARPFNHVGPGQEEGFLVPDLYAKLMAAKTTGRPIKVGNLSTKRDYTDVRDVVRAYSDLAHAKELKHNVYNICSGKSVAGQAILDQLLALMGANVKVEPDPALMRPNDNPDLYGSYRRLNQETGWQPKIPLQKTLSDFVASK